MTSEYKHKRLEEFDEKFVIKRIPEGWKPKIKVNDMKQFLSSVIDELEEKENLLPIVREQEKSLVELKNKYDALFEENRNLEKDKKDLMANLNGEQTKPLSEEE